MEITKRGIEKKTKKERGILQSNVNKKTWAAYTNDERVRRGENISKSKLGKTYGGNFSRVKPRTRICALNGCEIIVSEKITNFGVRKLNKYCCKEHRYKGGVRKSTRNTKFEIYRKEVWKFTNRNDLTLLDGYEFRGKMKVGTDNTNLDHIYSIKDGFDNGILPEIIGNISNLRFIHWMDNRLKKDASHITIEELKGKISQHDKRTPHYE